MAKKPNEVTRIKLVRVSGIKKLELEPGKRYLLFVDGKNLTFESAQDLNRLLLKHGFYVSIILTSGAPKVKVVEDSNPTPEKHEKS